MPERIRQLRFGGDFRPDIPIDVTPEGFAGFGSDESESLSRFVREVPGKVCVRSPSDAAQYLLEKVYTPFDDFDQEELWVLLLNTWVWISTKWLQPL